jgi:23S rRNA pseudouridine1911/1915/1917 synthase
MARSKHIELSDGTIIPILYEDRSIIAIDKPAGWMLIPYNWDKTSRNLHPALSSSILAGDHWARSRNLKYLRHVHRLDADTSGILLWPGVQVRCTHLAACLNRAG